MKGDLKKEQKSRKQQPNLPQYRMKMKAHTHSLITNSVRMKRNVSVWVRLEEKKPSERQLSTTIHMLKKRESETRTQEARGTCQCEKNNNGLQ